MWLRNGGAREADKRAGSEGDYRVRGEGEARVGFHAAVVVGGADGAVFEFVGGGRGGRGGG